MQDLDESTNLTSECFTNTLCALPFLCPAYVPKVGNGNPAYGPGPWHAVRGRGINDSQSSAHKSSLPWGKHFLYS